MIYYADLADEIRSVKEKGDYYEKLAEVLSLKSTLGIRTREAYLQKNSAELEELVLV